MKMWIFGVAALAAATCFGATTEDGVTKERRGALGPNDTVVTDVDTTGIVAARTYTKDEIDRRIATNAPVRSVNGRTGRVVLGASDVGALPDNRDDLKANANFRNAVWDVQIKSGGGVDTNAVREIAGEVVAPVEAAVADRYTKSEADGRFVPNNGQFNVGSDWMPFWNSQPLFYHDLGDVWVINPDRMHYSWRGIRSTPTTLSGYGITDGATTNDLESGLAEKRGVDDNICHKTDAYWVGEYEGQKYTFRYGMSYFGVECWNAGGVALFKRIGSDVTEDDLCPEDWTGIAYVGIAWTSSGNVAERRVEAVEGESYITRSIISAENPSFSNAVLAVGIDTNAVAQIGELKEFFDGLPVGTVGTSLGGIILALLAAVSLLKKNALTDGLETDGTPTDVKLDKFFTESNSLLNARIVYERNSTGLKDRAFNALTFDGTEFNLSAALASVTPTSDGQPRDLLIVATATAATTISFTAGTIKGDKPTIDGSGTWLITLTEYAANTWYCRQIKMEDAQ